MTSEQTMLWYDLETFGLNPKLDRIVQFAAIRTDMDMNPIDDGINIFCQQSADYLPDPESIEIHGVTPQEANSKGITELEFANQIFEIMSVPNTCILGYNNIKFDDEFIRNLFYRNLLPPYTREWKDGNSRWDILNLVRMTRGLRPNGIVWPDTNKLEEVASANYISHIKAHDALSDVKATIAVARLIKEKQPQLFNYFFENRGKKKCTEMLRIDQLNPLINSSGHYSNYISIIMPFVQSGRNSFMVYDLNFNCDPYLDLTADQILVEHLPVSSITTNKCPALAPISALDTDSQTRLELDLNSILANREKILSHHSFLKNISDRFAMKDFEKSNKNIDPEIAIYHADFPSDSDTQKMIKRNLNQDYSSSHLNELARRARLRNLSPYSTEWKQYCKDKLSNNNSEFRSIFDYNKAISNVKIELREQLYQYGQQIASFCDI